jgi:hypothetical protein
MKHNNNYLFTIIETRSNNVNYRQISKNNWKDHWQDFQDCKERTNQDCKQEQVAQRCIR